MRLAKLLYSTAYKIQAFIVTIMRVVKLPAMVEANKHSNI